MTSRSVMRELLTVRVTICQRCVSTDLSTSTRSVNGACQQIVSTDRSTRSVNGVCRQMRQQLCQAVDISRRQRCVLRALSTRSVNGACQQMRQRDPSTAYVNRCVNRSVNAICQRAVSTDASTRSVNGACQQMRQQQCQRCVSTSTAHVNSSVNVICQRHVSTGPRPLTKAAGASAFFTTATSNDQERSPAHLLSGHVDLLD